MNTVFILIFNILASSQAQTTKTTKTTTMIVTKTTTTTTTMITTKTTTTKTTTTTTPVLSPQDSFKGDNTKYFGGVPKRTRPKIGLKLCACCAISRSLRPNRVSRFQVSWLFWDLKKCIVISKNGWHCWNCSRSCSGWYWWCCWHWHFSLLTLLTMLKLFIFLKMSIMALKKTDFSASNHQGGPQW